MLTRLGMSEKLEPLNGGKVETIIGRKKEAAHQSQEGKG